MGTEYAVYVQQHFASGQCNINEPQSHGFVRYRIQPKSNLIAGDSITNNAAIYFDFNDPILTNTAYTQIVLPTSIQEIITSGNLLLYPNPANSSLTIETRTLIVFRWQTNRHRCCRSYATIKIA
jgi:hypothetical protein